MRSIAAIIVNYNYGRYVADAIESVIGQTDPFDEIIVVDDGSTDNSREIIAAYRDRAQVIFKPNGGRMSASIAGLKAARSDYVYILDADDFADPALVSSIREVLASDPVKVHFQLTGVDAERRPLGSVFPTFRAPYRSEEARRDNEVEGMYVYPPTSGNVYRRATLAALDLDRLDMQEPVDGAAALAMPYLGAILSLNQPLGFYRVHGENVSQWSRPSVCGLEKEIARFHRRWVDVCAFAGLERPPFRATVPLHVLQRRLMISALSAEGSTAALAFRYLLRTPATRRSWKHKAFLMAWAAAMIVPAPSFRRYLVFALRSPAHRPKWLRRRR